MDPKIVAAFGLLCLCSISSSIAASMMGGSETIEETKSAETDSGDSGDSGDSPEPYADWTVENGVDYPYNDIFHYHPNSDIKASKDVCLDKCEEMSNCKLVTFNNEKTLCWGKTKAENKRDHGDRNNYFKP